MYRVVPQTTKIELDSACANGRRWE